MGPGYTEIGQHQTSIGLIKAWKTFNHNDPEWDRFLDESPDGQFEQSGLWAQARKINGWSCIRVVLTCEDRIISGFQALTRKKRFPGSIGYINRGPVTIPDSREINEILTLATTALENEAVQELDIQTIGETIFIYVNEDTAMTVIERLEENEFETTMVQHDRVANTVKIEVFKLKDENEEPLRILSEGDKLKAKDNATILSNGSQFLTKGKEYSIIGVNSPAFLEWEYSIIDDEGDIHAFDARDISIYFEVVK